MSGNKDAEKAGRPNTARRAVLTGGAVGLAAVAGSALGRSQPAEAQTLNPSVEDWINVTNNAGLTKLAKGNGTTDDTAAIQAALTAASPGEVVYLPGPTLGSTIVGTYLVSSPLVVPKGVILAGCVPVGELASGFTGHYGSTLRVSSSWAQGSAAEPGVIVVDGSSATQYNCAIKDLWIDCHTGPAPSGVHGIATAGSVFHLVIDRVGIVAPTGMGIYAPNQSTGRPDGWQISNMIIEEPVSDGVHYEGQDCWMSNVHVQNGNTNGTGDGFVIKGGNNRLIGCRADSCTNGYTIDTRQNGQFFGSTILSACGTESNLENGLNVINSSSSSTAMSDPVIANGCSFDGDGISGTPYAGIGVYGANIVILNGCNICVAGSTLSPQYALTFTNAVSGTRNPGGSDPTLIQALGGFWQAVSSTLVNGSDANTVLSYGVHGFTGGQFGHGDAVATFEHNQL